MPAPLSSLDVETPLGFRVVCSTGYWHRITTAKHPVMRDRLASVHQTLADPDEVRRSMYDDDVLLFHRRSGERWICAVVKRAGNMGYLITAYPADRIKRGELLWTR